MAAARLTCQIRKGGVHRHVHRRMAAGATDLEMAAAWVDRAFVAILRRRLKEFRRVVCVILTIRWIH